MKKLIILLLPFLFFCGCSEKKYKEITLKTLEQKVEKKETFILMIGAASCTHCKGYKSTINEVIKDYNITIYYIDVDKLTETENSRLKKIASYKGTPTTVFLTKGKEESTYTRIIGERDYDYVVNKLKKNGYIKKVKE